MKPPIETLAKRHVIVGIFCLCLFTFADPASAYESFTTRIGFYQGFDINTGMTEIDPTVITIIIGSTDEIQAIAEPEIDPLFEFSPDVDVYFALTTDPDYPIEIIAENILGLAVLPDTSIDLVTDDLLATLDFTGTSAMIDSDDLVILLTQDEEYVILGHVVNYPDATVGLTYWRSEIPEPATLLLLGVGLVGLISVMKRKHINRSRKGGKGMKQWKTCLLALALVPLLVGMASAAEVRVIKIGTGSGMVRGEKIFCGVFSCKAMYEEGTVVHLKAIPDSGSRFVEWMVNGEPHEGVITIDQEDIIVAAKFELESGLDDLTIMWYNGDRKAMATMVLDEAMVFFELDVQSFSR